VPEWAREKRAALAEEEARSLYLACDQARDLDPANSSRHRTKLIDCHYGYPRMSGD